MDTILSSFSKSFKAQITDYLQEPILLLLGIYVKFFKRLRKLPARDFVIMMFAASFRSKPTTLVEMTSLLKESNPSLSITPQSLSERINSPECSHFFKTILEHALRTKSQKLSACPKLLSLFERTLVEDSSKFELEEELQEKFRGQGGNASKAALKMHTVYDLSNNRFIIMSEHSGTVSDRTLGNTTVGILQKGDLLIRDLGFFNKEKLREISKIGAFYLSRLPSNVDIRLSPNGEPIPFSRLFKEHSLDGVCLDIEVFIGESRKELLKVRLVAYRVPEEVANERRRLINKTSKHRGRKTSEETLSRQNFTIFVTNVRVEIWPSDIVETIYKIRWDIELIYKSWKSQLKICFFTGTKNHNRVRSFLYAKWAVIILCTMIYGLVFGYAKEKLGREASWHKFLNWFLIGNRFRDILTRRFVTPILRGLLEELKNGWCKDKRSKRKSTRQRIEDKQACYTENNYNNIKVSCLT